MATSSLVTIVIPAFNYGHLIAHTLDSVGAQSAPHWECLVVDDGSTDETARTVADFAHRDPRFRYLSQRNAGLSAARNAGLRQAKGTYLQFLDADDLIEEKKLEYQAAHLDAHPEVGIVYGPARYFPTDDVSRRRYSPTDPDRPFMPEVSGSGAVMVSALLHANIMPVNSALVRREVVDRVGYFDERLHALEDWEYWIRCALAGVQFHFLDRERTHGLVRIHAGSMSTDSLRMRTALVRHYRGTIRLAPDPATRAVLRQRLAYARGALSVTQISRGMIIRGGLARVFLALSEGQYRVAAKVILAILLAPIIGRARFAAWTE